MKNMALTLTLILICVSTNSTFGDDPGPIDLQTYIRHIQEQFVKLQENKDDKLPMYAEKVTIEMTVYAKACGSAGVQLYVFEAGGDIENSSTQKITVDLYFDKREGMIPLAYFPAAGGVIPGTTPTLGLNAISLPKLEDSQLVYMADEKSDALVPVLIDKKRLEKINPEILKKINRGRLKEIQ